MRIRTGSSILDVQYVRCEEPQVIRTFVRSVSTSSTTRYTLFTYSLPISNVHTSYICCIHSKYSKVEVWYMFPLTEELFMRVCVHLVKCPSQFLFYAFLLACNIRHISPLSGTLWARCVDESTAIALTFALTSCQRTRGIRYEVWKLKHITITAAVNHPSIYVDPNLCVVIRLLCRVCTVNIQVRKHILLYEIVRLPPSNLS